MAQTSGQMSIASGKLEYSTSSDMSGSVDVSGAATRVDPGRIKRGVGGKHTLSGDKKLLTKGKLEETRVAFEIIFEQGASSFFEALLALHVAGTPIYLRWTPAGGSSGDFQFTSSGIGYIEDMALPGNAEAGSPDPLVCEIIGVWPSLAKTDVAP